MLVVVGKILFTPFLLAICTLVAHRWGNAVGGWLLGLPITSGPVSVFLLAEHGAGFAEKAAQATLLGVVAAAVFCACYASVASKMRWWQSLGVAYGACLATALTLSLAHLSLPESIALALVALAVVAIGMRVTSVRNAERAAAQSADEPAADSMGAPVDPEPTSGLPARMFAAAVSVIAITAAASLLGPGVGGLLAPLPVLAAVMAASSHRRGARREAQGLLRGAIVGSWGGVAFFAVVAIMLPVAGPLATYGAATLAALFAGAVAVTVRERSGSAFGSWLGAQAS